MPITILGVDGKPFTTRDIDAEGNNFVYVKNLLQFSGNYATGGDTLDLTAIAGLIPSGSVPVYIQAVGIGTAAVPSLSAAGGFYQVIQNAVPALATYLLKLFANNGSGAISEYSAGAYGTDALGDIPILETVWRKLF